jgi:hypothetical protein
MAGKGRFVKAAVIYAAKYGPIVFEAVKHGREPAQRALQKALARQSYRRRARDHALTVVDGSVLRVFHKGEPIWVVFSADTPIASYPVVDTPLETVLEHADLSLRVRPETLADRWVVPDPRQLPKLVLRIVHRRPPRS